MMLHALKWANLRTRMFFYPDGDAGGSEAPSTPSGGDGGGGGANGGTSAPTSSPSPDGGGVTPPGAAPVPPATPTTPVAPEFDWAALGSSDDLDYIPTPAVTPPAAPQTSQTPPQAAPAAPAAQTPPAPQAQPQQPTPTEQPGETRPLTAADPMGIAAGLEANRDAIIAHLATSKFALSEADIKDLDTDVTVAVPKLLARAFLESQVSMQKFMAQAVPAMLQKYNRVTSANDTAEKKFFAAHKALDANNPQHRDAVVRMATVYRQANPGIPLDQLIQEVGPMVMTALRIGAVAPAAATHRPPKGGTPFTPAVNGGGGISPTPEVPNEWMGLGQNYDE